MLHIGTKIASLRKSAGFSQDELAEKLFVSRELVSKWETGKRNPDYQMIEKISRLFSVSAEELFDADDYFLNEISICFPAECTISQEKFINLLNSFLNELSDTDRTVFISRYYFGHSSGQTASLLGLKSSTVRKKLTMIRTKLTDYVKENPDG